MLGIISDIHGNLPGLNLVLSALAAQKCQKIICLGDVVDGGDYNEEVVDRIQGLKIECVRGNHDEINSADLDEQRQAWLDSLPTEIMCKDMCFTHISPRPQRKRKLNTATEAWNVFDETEFRLIFVGHTHISAIFEHSNDVVGTSLEIPFQFNEPLRLGANTRYVISPGAIGYSRDSKKTIRYGLYDEARNAMTMCELDGPTIQ